MRSPHRPRTSLARSTLIKMGVRVAVIIILTTIFSYLHIFRAFLAESLAQLERSVAKRVEQEQALFSQAEDNHVILKKALEEQIRAWQKLDPQPRFDGLLEPREDGTLHHRTEGFDGTSMPQVFVTTGVKVDDDFRRRLLAAYDVVARFGPASRSIWTWPPSECAPLTRAWRWSSAGTWIPQWERWNCSGRPPRLHRNARAP